MGQTRFLVFTPQPGRIGFKIQVVYLPIDLKLSLFFFISEHGGPRSSPHGRCRVPLCPRVSCGVLFVSLVVNDVITGVPYRSLREHRGTLQEPQRTQGYPTAASQNTGVPYSSLTEHRGHRFSSSTQCDRFRTASSSFGSWVLTVLFELLSP